MLVTNRFAPGDILGLKLVNGDEILAKLVVENATEFEVTKPFAIVPSQNGVALMNAMFTMSQDYAKPVIIKKEHVMMACEAEGRLASHYLETTTGIQTVTKGSIIT